MSTQFSARAKGLLLSFSDNLASFPWSVVSVLEIQDSPSPLHKPTWKLKLREVNWQAQSIITHSISSWGYHKNNGTKLVA